MDFAGVLDRVEAFLTERGWRFALAGGVALAAYGNPRLNFSYVRDETAAKLFAGVVVAPGPAGRPVPVPRKEHLIAMKVQVMKNDPSRTLQDMADIEYLLKLDGTNRDEARASFVKAGLLERWEELTRGL